MPPAINNQQQLAAPPKTIVLEHIVPSPPSKFGGGGAHDTAIAAGERSVTVPLQLHKLRECIQPSESVSTAAFEMPPRLADQGWQWQLRVFPNGQHRSEDQLVVYLVLVGIGGAPNAAAAATDAERATNGCGAAAAADDDVPMRLERQLLDVSVRLVYRDKRQNRQEMRSPRVSQLFDWAEKPRRWTRHAFDMKAAGLRHCKTAELVCELRDPNGSGDG